MRRARQPIRLALAAGLACLGAAACFLMPAYYVNPQVGNGFVLVAFTIVVLGGMGSVPGALVGGLTIGLIELYSGATLPEGFKDTMPYIVLLVMLWVRPQGMFGTLGRKKV